METTKSITGITVVIGESGSSSAAHCDEDLPLVDAAKNGDLTAFEQLVKRYDRRLLRIAQNVTHDLGDAQDVVQDAFLKAYQKLDQFRARARFSTWLIRITLNEALMMVRKMRNQREVSAEEVQDEIETTPSRLSYWARNPEQLYSASELREILQQSLETLSPALRIVFLLRDVEDLSIDETAEALGLSAVAVKARLFRARLQLRDKLSKHFATGDEHSEFSVRSIRRPLNMDFDHLMTSFLQSSLR
jgi:RNA polymerase sigma-70 factor (ECF subfamily)